MNPSSSTPRRPVAAPVRSGIRRGFTLIELLAVIAILGVLATIILGMTSLATRKARVARVEAQLAQLESAIRSYKATFGFFPPDTLLNEDLAIDPQINPLFYELRGSIYNRTDNTYRPQGSSPSDAISASNVEFLFKRRGIVNSAESEEGLAGRNFIEGIKANQIQWVGFTNPQVTYQTLSVGMEGVNNLPALDPDDLLGVNSWNYVSTNPTNNPNGFDLWAVIKFANTNIVIGNWSER